MRKKAFWVRNNSYKVLSTQLPSHFPCPLLQQGHTITHLTECPCFFNICESDRDADFHLFKFLTCLINLFSLFIENNFFLITILINICFREGDKNLLGMTKYYCLVKIYVMENHVKYIIDT